MCTIVSWLQIHLHSFGRVRICAPEVAFDKVSIGGKLSPASRDDWIKDSRTKMPFSWRECVATQAGEVAGLSRGRTGRQGRDTWTPLGQCLFEITPYFRSGEVRLRRIVKSLLSEPLARSHSTSSKGGQLLSARWDSHSRVFKLFIDLSYHISSFHHPV
jgi:hypothetical protein